MRINGIPVVDTASKLQLHITAADVKKGDTKDPGACAAARCLLRMPEVEAARVHIGRTYVKKGSKWVRYQTPRSLRSEIIAFDRGGKFEPGEYTLVPLPPSSREGRGKRQGSNKPGGARDKGSKDRTPKKKRAKPHMITNVRAHGANR